LPFVENYQLLRLVPKAIMVHVIPESFFKRVTFGELGYIGDA